ncbi:MAG TPA: HAMP domain-containing sensor histidine kinase [Acidobacteriota bacterium]|nr:HAMP domain-containing sensor histidine kinase [Acidobacteriota bacterium]
MDSRILMETAGGALGLLLYLYLFLTLLGHPRDRLRLALLLLTAAVMLWFGGNAGAHLVSAPAPGLQRPLLLSAYAGLALLPPLVLGTHWVYFRRLRHPSLWQQRGFRMSLGLLVLGAVLSPWGLQRLVQASPSDLPWPALRGLVLPYLLLLALSYLHSAYLQVRIRMVLPRGAERRLFALLPPLFLLLPLFNLLAYPWSWPVQGWGSSALQAWLLSLSKLGALAPGGLIAYFVFRHRFLRLRSMRRPAALLVTAAGIVLYLSLERLVAISLEPSSASWAMLARGVLLGGILLSFTAAARWMERLLNAAVADEERRRMEEKLAEKSHLEDLGRMAATVAHNVKNPLSSMKTLMQLWRESDNLTEEQRGEVAMMIAEVDRLSETVTSLLRFSRLKKEGDDRDRYERVDLEALLEKVAGLFRGEIESRRLLLSLDVQPAGGEVRSRPRVLEEVLGNLLGNAMEACKPGDEIALEGRVEHNRWWIRVRDNGRGIPSSIRPQLFEPFVSDKSKGTGLGLAIVKQQVERLGGRVELEPTQRGASFRLMFGDLGSSLTGGFGKNKHEDTDRRR